MKRYFIQLYERYVSRFGYAIHTTDMYYSIKKKDLSYNFSYFLMSTW